MTSLLRTLNTELVALNESGTSNLESLLFESKSALSELHDLEAELAAQIETETPNTESMEIEHPGEDFIGRVERQNKMWYKASIDKLKAYNAQITKFQRNTVNSSAYSVDLDDAYTFPLMLDSFPSKEMGTSSDTKSREISQKSGLAVDTSTSKTDPHLGGVEMGPGNGVNTGEAYAIKAQNRQQLMCSIVLHLLKSGYGNVVVDMLDDFGVAGNIDHVTLSKLMELSDIVNDIKKRHDLTRALQWLASRDSTAKNHHNSVSFKLHMLQFVLLLTGKNTAESGDFSALENGAASQNVAAALDAYTYSKTHFPQYLKDHISDISPIMSLLLFRTNPTDEESVGHLALFRQKILQAFVNSTETQKRSAHETQYVAEILAHFDRIHERVELFEKLAVEFVQEFCRGLGLSTESSLFQAVLAGHVNLPNFHKYSQVQKRLRRKSVTAADPETAGSSAHDLPFSLPSKNQFLFNFHPIFICPISKEQLVPIISSKRVADADDHDRKRKQLFVANNEVLVSPGNPVVVFEHCRHLALKESVRHLTKNGTDVFKCHYCYKKHKLSEVSDAYFIDL